MNPTPIRLRYAVSILATSLLAGLVGCGGLSTSASTPTSPAAESPAAAATARSTDAPTTDANPLERLDVAKVIASCDAPLPTPPVPTYRKPEDAARSFGMSVFTAHPDDEAMYAGGVITALTMRGHRVSLAPMSHGEGGRLLLPKESSSDTASRKAPDGAAGRSSMLVERRDVTWQQVAKTRDPEMAEAARRMGADLLYLNEASAHADYGWTTSCSESLAHWEKNLPGGLRGIMTKMIADIRERKPRIVLTLDPRDDPQASHHGHHKAVGVLAELSARMAADPNVPGLPHAIEELLTMAPAGVRGIDVPVDARARRRALDAHVSQFWPKDLDGFGMRPTETFVVRWRAKDAPPPPTGSASLLRVLLQDSPKTGP